MDRDAFLQQLLKNPTGASLQNPLPDDDAEWLVTRLKQEADRHWYIDPNCSLAYADLIVKIGQARGDARQVALGTMARGDAIKLLGRIQEAWDTLGLAGKVFQCAGDEVGWARTRIGRLWISVELDRVTEALADAERARDIFTRFGRDDMLLRLEHNLATVYNLLGDHQQAIARYESALTVAETLGDTVKDHVVYIYGNLGYAHNFLGNFRQALAYYQRAYDLSVANQQTTSAALAELNIAYIAVAQGHYRRALRLLHGVESLAGDQFPKESAMARRQMVECYLYLNRYVEARDLARQAIAEYQRQGASYEAARTLMFLAQAEAELGHFEAAQAALDRAEPIYTSMGSTTWAATVALRRGQIALQRGDTAAARQQAAIAQQGFEASSRRVSYAEALLLDAQAQFTNADFDSAEQAAVKAAGIARSCNIPALRYSAHLLLGQIAEARGRLNRATRHYAAADATIQRVQRSLTITLRPGFLQDKGEALRALIRLNLQAGQTAQAFEALERAKSQALLSYLGNREQLHWADDDPHTRELIAELNRLRDEHHWFYRVAHQSGEDQTTKIKPEEALAEMAARERRMRTLTERLYLQNRSGDLHYALVPSVDEIRRSLDDGVLLIEYFNDGANLWAFTLDRSGLSVYPLEITVTALDALIDRLRRYIDRALRATPNVLSQLNQATQQTARQLYDSLLKPLEAQLAASHRLIMVPYGALHYLPFHLLYSGRGYLVENYEVAVLPAASLVKHRSAQRSGGALVLAHSQNGRLPQTLAEARIVHDLFGGSIFCEEAAQRDTLLTAPRQILHIAAHGEHRIDQPDFSYIQLADGQLLSDDVMQRDLSYELVTLSGCETGLARVAPGDELIGLGRGFLYAGAGALIVSLWRVDDRTATQLMEYLYGALWAGESKAAALRQAQRALLALKPDLHPAFWGAFQLVGDPSPLTMDMQQEEYEDVRLATA